MTRPFALLLLFLWTHPVDAQSSDPLTRPNRPKVKDRDWCQNPIDYFVLDQLEKAGSKPAPEADRATLIRRLSLDLTGQSATSREVDIFLADKSLRAYEKVVERLLASPRFGERMGQLWFDAEGCRADGEPTTRRWRDWMVAAFNANMPLDQIMREQTSSPMKMDEMPSPSPPRRGSCDQPAILRVFVVPSPNSAMARDAVDRYWRMLFGVGLESTELRDWLSSELREPSLINCCRLDEPLPHAWDVKHLLKAIATSATYRSSGCRFRGSAQLQGEKSLTQRRKAAETNRGALILP